MISLLTLCFSASAILLAGHCDQRDDISIPHGHPILLDGRIGAAEWTEACRIQVAPDYQLMVKHDAAYLYLAVVRDSPAVFGVNLYLAPRRSTTAYLNLHASAKLGERVGRRAAWPDWAWWNNRGWSANALRFNAFSGQQFLPDTVREFQIAIARLPGTRFLLSFDVETADGIEVPVVDGPILDGAHWIGLHLTP